MQRADDLENVGVAIASTAVNLAMWDRLAFGSPKVNALSRVQFG